MSTPRKGGYEPTAAGAAPTIPPPKPGRVQNALAAAEAEVERLTAENRLWVEKQVRPQEIIDRLQAAEARTQQLEEAIVRFADSPVDATHTLYGHGCPHCDAETALYAIAHAVLAAGGPTKEGEA